MSREATEGYNEGWEVPSSVCLLRSRKNSELTQEKDKGQQVENEGPSCPLRGDTLDLGLGPYRCV